MYATTDVNAMTAKVWKFVIVVMGRCSMLHETRCISGDGRDILSSIMISSGASGGWRGLLSLSDSIGEAMLLAFWNVSHVVHTDAHASFVACASAPRWSSLRYKTYQTPDETVFSSPSGSSIILNLWFKSPSFGYSWVDVDSKPSYPRHNHWEVSISATDLGTDLKVHHKNE